MAGGGRVLPYRSNLEEISKFTFEILDGTYYERAMEIRDAGGHVIIGGSNYGQGSSREHAALAPRYLGLRFVIVKDYARIHWQNLVNFGVLPLEFVHEEDYDMLEKGDVLRVKNLHKSLPATSAVEVEVKGKGVIDAKHSLSKRQIDVMLHGGLINWVRQGEAKNS